MVLTGFRPTIGGILTQGCPVIFKILKSRHDSPKIPKTAVPPFGFEAKNFFFLLFFPRSPPPPLSSNFVKFNRCHTLTLKRDLTFAIDANECFPSEILREPMKNNENDGEINFEHMGDTKVVVIIFDTRTLASGRFHPLSSLSLALSLSFLLLPSHLPSISFSRSFTRSLENLYLPFSLTPCHTP